MTFFPLSVSLTLPQRRARLFVSLCGRSKSIEKVKLFYAHSDFCRYIFSARIKRLGHFSMRFGCLAVRTGFAFAILCLCFSLSFSSKRTKAPKREQPNKKTAQQNDKVLCFMAFLVVVFDHFSAPRAHHPPCTCTAVEMFHCR